MILKDGVTFEHVIGRDNYVLKSPTAVVSIDDQTLVSDKGVEGEGPGGATLRAERIRANNRDGVVIFEGDVNMRLYPKKGTTLRRALRQNLARTESVMIRAGAFLVWVVAASAMMLAGASAQLAPEISDGPIDITGDRLEVVDDVATWTGNVRAVQGEALLTAEKLIADLDDSGSLYAHPRHRIGSLLKR